MTLLQALVERSDGASILQTAQMTRWRGFDVMTRLRYKQRRQMRWQLTTRHYQPSFRQKHSARAPALRLRRRQSHLFWAIAGVGLATLAALSLTLPRQPAPRDSSLGAELRCSFAS